MSDTIILRRWSSRILSKDQAAYTAYIQATGVSDYLAVDGNLGCQMLMRDLGDGTSEVTTLSWWRSMDAIRAFAGEEVARARYYPEDDRYLIDKPETVEHHDIVVEAAGLAQRRDS